MNFDYIKRTPQIQTGSALMRLIDKSNLSKIDLLIRESVQNSFDAQKPEGSYIDYKIFNNLFNTRDFLSIINNIKVCTNIKSDEGKCIIIQDYNTVGLNGLFESERINYSSNFYKLIYDNGNPQNQDNAGGSWGYGKTIYYQVGIGIVLYYTRTIKNEHYEEYLIMNLIENEKSEKSILNMNYYKDNVGIAYWGLKKNNNIMMPITNESEIDQILKIFNVKRYTETNTGTTIIIPFINENDLINDYLQHRKKDDENLKEDLNEIIVNTISKWFTLKLSNNLYKKYINFYVDSNKIEISNIKKAYKVIQELYNSLYENNNDNITVKDIKINNDLSDTLAGRLIYKKFASKELNMLKPINEKSPYYYYNINNGEELDGMNAPIIAYCREPGMIINYETGTDWLKSVSPTSNDEYLIALFVLNSNNKVVDKNISLDGYIRKGEASNHNGWTDYNSEKRIVKKIKNGVNRVLKSTNDKRISSEGEVETSMGQYYTKYFLPPLGFGKLPSRITKNSKSNTKMVITRNGALYKIVYTVKALNNNKIVFEIAIDYNNSFEKIRLYLAIESQPTKITSEEWERNTNKRFPLSITTKDSSNLDYSLKINNKKNCIDVENLSNSNSIVFDVEIEIIDNKYSPTFIKE